MTTTATRVTRDQWRLQAARDKVARLDEALGDARRARVELIRAVLAADNPPSISQVSRLSGMSRQHIYTLLEH